jgi:hypothetical protein
MKRRQVYPELERNGLAAIRGSDGFSFSRRCSSRAQKAYPYTKGVVGKGIFVAEPVDNLLKGKEV